MPKILVRTITGAALAAGAGAMAYPVFFRRRCLSWGATAEEDIPEASGR